MNGCVWNFKRSRGTSGVASAFSSIYNNFKKFCCEFLRQGIVQVLQLLEPGGFTIGNPSSKYEHRQTPALLRNIRKIRICLGKKLIVSVTYENERILIKNSLPYLKCVLRLSCVVHGRENGLHKNP